MKLLAKILFIAITVSANAKESKELDQAFKKYQDKEPSLIKIEVAPLAALTDLLRKEKEAMAVKSSTPLEEVLAVMSVVRDSPSKEFIPHLKEIWLIRQKATFRVIFPNDWRWVKARDYNQDLCNEIKILIKGMGGAVEDLKEPESDGKKAPDAPSK